MLPLYHGHIAVAAVIVQSELAILLVSPTRIGILRVETMAFHLCIHITLHTADGQWRFIHVDRIEFREWIWRVDIETICRGEDKSLKTMLDIQISLGKEEAIYLQWVGCVGKTWKLKHRNSRAACVENVLGRQRERIEEKSIMFSASLYLCWSIYHSFFINIQLSNILQTL